MVRVSSPAKLRPWSELTAKNGDGGGSCVGEVRESWNDSQESGKFARLCESIRANRAI